MGGEERTRAALLEDFNGVMNRVAQMKDGFYARQLDALGLTLLQFTALQAIHRLGPDVSVGEIGEAIGAPPSTMTSLTNRLVTLGLISRSTPPDNRRAVQVRTTAQGADLVQDFHCQRDEDAQVIFESMTNEQLEYLTGVLHLVAEGIARRLAEKQSPAGEV